jgi:hypothetical protein
MTNIRYPNITGRTDAEKLQQMESYLRQLVDQLNHTLMALEKENKERKA